MTEDDYVPGEPLLRDVYYPCAICKCDRTGRCDCLCHPPEEPGEGPGGAG